MIGAEQKRGPIPLAGRFQRLAQHPKRFVGERDAIEVVRAPTHYQSTRGTAVDRRRMWNRQMN
jgi:hypothetical protein